MSVYVYEQLKWIKVSLVETLEINLYSEKTVIIGFNFKRMGKWRLTETGWNFLGNFLTEIGVKSLIQRISKKFPEFFTANFRILIKRLK